MNTQNNLISNRKDAHLALSLNPDLRGNGPDLSHVHLPYAAHFPIPESKLITNTKIADIPLNFPLVIASMTGGTHAASKFNSFLRSVAQKYNIGLGLGSIRACLADPSLIPTYGSGDAPWIFGNIGISEIIHQSYPVDVIRESLKKLGCSGLYIHFNVIQEWLQPEGDHDLFTDIDILSRFIDNLKLPVILKEVGSGIAGNAAKRLSHLNIRGIETASKSGTSWVKIEALRRHPPLPPDFVDALDQLGYDLQTCIRDCRIALGPRSLIASGGIDNPLSLVKSLALGADAVAIAQPVYAAYHNLGPDYASQWIQDIMNISKLIWRSTGAHNISSLRNIVESNH